MARGYDDYARAALALTSRLVARHGPRVSGTQGCRAARTELEGLLSSSCTDTRREAFRIRPESLYAIGKVFAASYSIGLAAAWLGGFAALGAGLAAMALALAYFAANFLLYLDAFDGLFEPTDAENVVGILEPEGPPLRQVLLVGHHDSARIYSFYQRHASIFPLRLLLAVLFFLSCLVALAQALIAGLAAGLPPALPLWEKCTLAAGAIFAFPMWRYISKEGSPGAGDNLIGCAIALALAERFSEAPDRLAGTRLAVLLSDGEEAGQKGAKAFIAANRKFLGALETIVINVDSIYDYEDIAILRRDRNGITKLSPKLAEALRATARDRGHELKYGSIPFLGGGTDASHFALAGYATASIIGLPIGVGRKEILMHTSRDLPEAISEKAVGAVIEVVAEYIRALDGDGLRSGRGIRDRG